MTLEKASIHDPRVSADCRAALHVFATGDFRRWRGLPADCELSTITGSDTLRLQAEGAGMLGQRRASYRMIAIEHYAEPVRVWHYYGRILLMDVRYPVISPGLTDLLPALGKPEILLDSHFSNIVLEKSEWVYASRGLSLFINPDNLLLLRLAAYPSTSIDDYHQKLRLQLEIQRRPISL